MKYITCPCGHSDRHDDKICSREVDSINYNSLEIIIKEVRQCDICSKKYGVLMHYKFSYEVLSGSE